MLRFRSLTAKFIFMGIIVLAFIAAYIIATFFLRINFSVPLPAESFKKLVLDGKSQ